MAKAIKNVDLGYTYDDMPMAVSEAEEPEIQYPRVFIRDAGRLPLAEEGVISFRFKLIEKVERTEAGEKKPDCSYELKLMELVEATAKAPDEDKSAKEALEDEFGEY